MTYGKGEGLLLRREGVFPGQKKVGHVPGIQTHCARKKKRRNGREGAKNLGEG